MNFSPSAAVALVGKLEDVHNARSSRDSGEIVTGRRSATV